MGGRNSSSSKLSDIRDTASDTVEILRQLGTPGVQETLDKAQSMTVTVKEIMETMKSPEWVQNMDNMRRIVEDMSRSSQAIHDTVREMKDTGVFEDLKGLMQSARRTMDSFSSQEEGGGGGQGAGIVRQDLHGMLVALREMLDSIRSLTEELKAAAAESRQSGAISDLKQAATSLSGAYETVAKKSGRAA